MSFSGTTLAMAARFLAQTLAGLVSIPTYAVDLKHNVKIAPGLPSTSSPSGTAAVDKLLHPQSLAPGMPMPTPNLSERSDVDQPL